MLCPPAKAGTGPALAPVSVPTETLPQAGGSLLGGGEGRWGHGQDSCRCVPRVSQGRAGVSLMNDEEEKGNACHRNPPLLGRRRPGSTRAGRVPSTLVRACPQALVGP